MITDMQKKKDNPPNPEGAGWRVVGVWDTREFFAKVIVPSAESPLKTSYEAIQFVLLGARSGDKTCVEALRQVAESNAARAKPTTKKAKRK